MWCLYDWQSKPKQLFEYCAIVFIPKSAFIHVKSSVHMCIDKAQNTLTYDCTIRSHIHLLHTKKRGHNGGSTLSLLLLLYKQQRPKVGFTHTPTLQHTVPDAPICTIYTSSGNCKKKKHDTCSQCPTILNIFVVAKHDLEIVVTDANSSVGLFSWCTG